MKQTKLTAKQWEVLELMSAGNRLVSTGGGLYFVADGRLRGVRVNRNTFDPMIYKKLVLTPVRSETWHWTLTDLGREALKERKSQFE